MRTANPRINSSRFEDGWCEIGRWSQFSTNTFVLPFVFVERARSHTTPRSVFQYRNHHRTVVRAVAPTRCEESCQTTFHHAFAHHNSFPSKEEESSSSSELSFIPLAAPRFVTMSRGNQREIDRQKAQAKLDAKKKNEGRVCTFFVFSECFRISHCCV